MGWTGRVLTLLAVATLALPGEPGAAVCRHKKRGTLVVKDSCTGKFLPVTAAELGGGAGTGGGLELGTDGLSVAPGAITTERLADGAVTPAKTGAVPAAGVFNSASQPVPGTGATFTALTFNSERFDTAGLHDSAGNPSRLTAPIAGLYLLTVNVSWEPSSAGGREVSLRKNGTVFVARDVVPPLMAPNTTEQSLSVLVSLAAGDFVEVVLRQNSGAPLVITALPEWSPEFSMIWLGPAA